MHENGRLFHSRALFRKPDLFHLVCRSHAKNQLVTGRIGNLNSICGAVSMQLLSLSEPGSRPCL
jgi:hypothetical protein